MATQFSTPPRLPLLGRVSICRGWFHTCSSICNRPLIIVHRPANLFVFVPARFLLLQVLTICGVGLVFFQLLVYPRIIKRIGTSTSQLWASCIAIPVYLAYPFLSLLGDTGDALMASSLVLLFFTNIAENAVGAKPASIQPCFSLKFKSIRRC